MTSEQFCLRFHAAGPRFNGERCSSLRSFHMNEGRITPVATQKPTGRILNALTSGDRYDVTMSLVADRNKETALL